MQIALNAWVDRTDWIENLAVVAGTRSNTSVCLKLSASAVPDWMTSRRRDLPKQIARLLEAEEVAFDIGAYRDAPAGLRVWCGATVEPSDVEALTAWLDWAYAQASEPVAA